MNQKVIFRCMYCNQGLRAPANKSLVVTCSACKKKMHVRTWPDSLHVSEITSECPGSGVSGASPVADQPSTSRLWVLAGLVGLFGLLIYWHVNRPYIATIEICNAAPYPINYLLSYKRPSSSKDIIEDFEFLGPGLCQKKTRKFNKDNAPQYYVHAQSIRNEKKIMWVYEHDLQSKDQIFWPPFGSTGARHLEVKRRSSIERLPFHRVKKAREDGKESKWEFFIYDAQVSSLTQRFSDCKSSCKSTALQRAQKLSSAVERQINFSNGFAGKNLPYFISTELIDDNGPFNVGVRVKGVMAESMFGDPLPLREGDIVHSLNGVTVFSPDDLYIILHHHATSRSAGIEKPIDIDVVRGGSLYRLETVFFFNYNYWGSSPTDELKTIGYGITDAMSLGVAAQAVCGGKKGLQGLRNVASWLGEKGVDAIFDKKVDFGRSKITDYGECAWNAEQSIARLRQYDNDLFVNSAWFTIVTPSAPRLLLSKHLSKGLRSASISKGLAKRVSTMMLETSETLLWTINGASPLTSPKGVVTNLKNVAPYAAGVGIVAGALARR